MIKIGDLKEMPAEDREEFVRSAIVRVDTLDKLIDLEEERILAAKEKLREMRTEHASLKALIGWAEVFNRRESS